MPCPHVGSWLPHAVGSIATRPVLAASVPVASHRQSCGGKDSVPLRPHRVKPCPAICSQWSPIDTYAMIGALQGMFERAFRDSLARVLIHPVAAFIYSTMLQRIVAGRSLDNRYTGARKPKLSTSVPRPTFDEGAMADLPAGCV